MGVFRILGGVTLVLATAMSQAVSQNASDEYAVELAKKFFLEDVVNNEYKPNVAVARSTSRFLFAQTDGNDEWDKLTDRQRFLISYGVGRRNKFISQEVSKTKPNIDNIDALVLDRGERYAQLRCRSAFKSILEAHIYYLEYISEMTDVATQVIKIQNRNGAANYRIKDSDLDSVEFSLDDRNIGIAIEIFGGKAVFDKNHLVGMSFRDIKENILEKDVVKEGIIYDSRVLDEKDNQEFRFFHVIVYPDGNRSGNPFIIQMIEVNDNLLEVQIDYVDHSGDYLTDINQRLGPEKARKFDHVYPRIEASVPKGFR